MFYNSTYCYVPGLIYKFKISEMKECLEREKSLAREANEKATRAEIEAEQKCAHLKESNLVELQNLVQENTQLLRKIQVILFYFHLPLSSSYLIRSSS